MDVEDEGIGIPAEMVDRVFDIFTRVEQEGEPVQEGLGIGLSVAKRLTEMHGGSIEVHSAGRGKGSRFRVIAAIGRRGTGCRQIGRPHRGSKARVRCAESSSSTTTPTRPPAWRP